MTGKAQLVNHSGGLYAMELLTTVLWGKLADLGSFVKHFSKGSSFSFLQLKCFAWRCLFQRCFDRKLWKGVFVLTPLFCLNCFFSVSVKRLLVSKQKHFEISVLQNDLRF